MLNFKTLFNMKTIIIVICLFLFSLKLVCQERDSSIQNYVYEKYTQQDLLNTGFYDLFSSLNNLFYFDYIDLNEEALMNKLANFNHAKIIVDYALVDFNYAKSLSVFNIEEVIITTNNGEIHGGINELTTVINIKTKTASTSKIEDEVNNFTQLRFKKNSDNIPNYIRGFQNLSRLDDSFLQEDLPEYSNSTNINISQIKGKFHYVLNTNITYQEKKDNIFYTNSNAIFDHNNILDSDFKFKLEYKGTKLRLSNTVSYDLQNYFGNTYKTFSNSFAVNYFSKKGLNIDLAANYSDKSLYGYATSKDFSIKGTIAYKIKFNNSFVKLFSNLNYLDSDYSKFFFEYFGTDNGFNSVQLGMKFNYKNIFTLGAVASKSEENIIKQHMSYINYSEDDDDQFFESGLDFGKLKHSKKVVSYRADDYKYFGNELDHYAFTLNYSIKNNFNCLKDYAYFNLFVDYKQLDFQTEKLFLSHNRYDNSYNLFSVGLKAKTQNNKYSYGFKLNNYKIDYLNYYTLGYNYIETKNSYEVFFKGSLYENKKFKSLLDLHINRGGGLFWVNQFKHNHLSIYAKLGLSERQGVYRIEDVGFVNNGEVSLGFKNLIVQYNLTDYLTKYNIKNANLALTLNNFLNYVLNDDIKESYYSYTRVLLKASIKF